MDKLINSFLSIRSQFLKHFDVRGQEEPPTQNMKLIFEDDFHQFDPNKWHIGQFWGKFHPQLRHQYYGNDSVYIENNSLCLDIRYKPSVEQHYSLSEPQEIPYSVGLVVSQQTFGPGFYQFEITLPCGFYLWPAVWLTGTQTWPPEIDIIEAYSDQFTIYNDRLETNIHYDIFPKNKSLGALRHPVKLKDDQRIRVSCWWTQDFIKIYYNGFLVRKVTDKKVLKWFQDQKMRIILNNAIRPEGVKYFDRLIKENKQLHNLPLTKFKIHSVKIWGSTH